MVSVLALYFDDPSSKLAEAYSFSSVKLWKINEKHNLMIARGEQTEKYSVYPNDTNGPALFVVEDGAC